MNILNITSTLPVSNKQNPTPTVFTWECGELGTRMECLGYIQEKGGDTWEHFRTLSHRLFEKGTLLF